jgi:hypothetical protein
VLAFALFSAVAGVVWVIGGTWPWLLIALGAWMFWHEDGRHSRARRNSRTSWWAGHARSVASESRQQPVVSSKPDKSSAAEEKAARPLSQTELPIDLQVRVEQIRRKVDVLLGYADRFPPFSQDLYLVRQTASDYLPRTIDTFLGLSKDAVDRPLHPGGKTAREELKAQLDLLDAKLDDIAQDLQRQDADRVLANRRFLESRFGSRDASSPIDAANPEVA